MQQLAGTASMFALNNGYKVIDQKTQPEIVLVVRSKQFVNYCKQGKFIEVSEWKDTAIPLSVIQEGIIEATNNHHPTLLARLESILLKQSTPLSKVVKLLHNQQKNYKSARLTLSAVNLAR